MSDIATIGYIAKDCRWRATVTYEVDNGEMRSVVHDVMEIEDLQDLIESGPTFCAIRDFKIEYWGPRETIKESMEA